MRRVDGGGRRPSKAAEAPRSPFLGLRDQARAGPSSSGVRNVRNRSGYPHTDEVEVGQRERRGESRVDVPSSLPNEQRRGP